MKMKIFLKYIYCSDNMKCIYDGTECDGCKICQDVSKDYHVCILNRLKCIKCDECERIMDR